MAAEHTYVLSYAHFTEMSTVEVKDLNEASKHIIYRPKSRDSDENQKDFGFSIAFRKNFGIIVFGKNMT